MSKSNAPSPGSDPALIEIVPTWEGYERWAEIYDGEDNPLVLLETAHIGTLIGRVTGLKVVDIGCGTGRHAVRLAQEGALVTAVDFSEAMLARARAKPAAETIRFLRHDLARPLPLKNAAFDLVLCCLVLDHIADPGCLFAEFARLCRPDGGVVISAMHPAMSLRGVQARFTDPGSGRQVGPLSHPHRICDYIMSAFGAGLAVTQVSEHAADNALAAHSPRARKYVGWPMLLLMRLVHIDALGRRR
jgi:SAM-dependent methyltransferase